MSTVAVYRFKAEEISFATVGQLQQHGGLYVLVASAKVDDVALLAELERAQKPIKILCEIGGEVIAVMPVIKWRTKARFGSQVELWIIVG